MDYLKKIIACTGRQRSSALSRLSRWTERALAIPPPLSVPYDLFDFGRFMRQEIHRYTPKYARKRVIIAGVEHLHAALAESSVVIGLLHHGSWILIGGALTWQLTVPYSVIASRRNLAVCPHAERKYWTEVHGRLPAFYRNPIFFTDESPFQVARWLRTGKRALGVALDVRETGQRHKEYPVRFAGHTLHMQTGAARIARLVGGSIVPAAILYDPKKRMHTLHLLPAVAAECLDPVAATQAVLEALEPHYLAAPEQAFHHLISNFSRPHQA